MLLSRFGKLESVERKCLASLVIEHSLFMSEYYVPLFDAGQGRSNCSGKLIELVHTCCVCVNAIFFLRSIHPVHLQCDIREIDAYFCAMCTSTCAVCTRPPFLVGGLGTRLGIVVTYVCPVPLKPCLVQ